MAQIGMIRQELVTEEKWGSPAHFKPFVLASGHAHDEKVGHVAKKKQGAMAGL